MKRFLAIFFYYFFLPVLVLATLVFLVFTGRNLYNNYLTLSTEVSVPKVIGLSLDQARKLLSTSYLELEILERKFDKNTPANTVINQFPPEGRKVKAGRVISLTVSLGTETVGIPDVTGKNDREGRLILENAGFRVGKIEYISDKSRNWGEIVKQEPLAGSELPLLSRVDLKVNQAGKTTKKVPNLTGEPLLTAIAILNKNNLKLGRLNWVWQEMARRGEIVGQSPAEEKEVSPESEIDLEVSAGYREEKTALRQRFFHFSIPKGEDPQSVKLLLTDDLGEYEIYRGTHLSGENLEILTTSWGEGEVQLIVNSQIVKREKF